MLDETRTTDNEGVPEISNPTNITDFSAHDWELVELIGRTAQRDEEALGTLYDKTGSHVYGLGFRVLGDTTMAEEVTMDVFLQVWRQAGQFDQSRGKPMVWLTVLTRSRAIDRLRVGKKDRICRQSMEEISEIMSKERNPEQHSVQSEQGRIVRHGLYSLPPEQREVIELGYFDGLSQSEIAQRTGQPIGTVKTRVRLGMVKLRTLLGPLGEGLIS